MWNLFMRHTEKPQPVGEVFDCLLQSAGYVSGLESGDMGNTCVWVHMCIHMYVRLVLSRS